MREFESLLVKCIAGWSFDFALKMGGWPCGFLFHQPKEPDELRRLCKSP